MWAIKRKIKTIYFSVIYISIFIVSMLSPLTFAFKINSNQSNLKLNVKSLPSNENWHKDDALSNDVVSITYTETLSESDEKQCDYFYYQTMLISFKDGTDTKVGFEFVNQFLKDGVDADKNTITDWDYLVYIEPTLIFESSVGPIFYQARYKFNGFYIVKGTVDDIEFENQTDDKSWYLTPKNIIGTIEFSNRSIQIGDINIKTRDYSGGIASKEVIINFDVYINATIGTGNNIRYIPATLMVEVIHNINSTYYKYGVDVDWSKYKAFPTSENMSTGDDFCLVAYDRLNVGYGTGEITQFTVNDEKDQAIFTQNGIEYARQDFTTHYDIKNNESNLETERIYYKADSYDADMNRYTSKVFVCFGGFKYNQSTGIEFDPAFIFPSGFGTILIVILVALGIGITAVVIVIHKKRGKSKIKEVDKKEKEEITKDSAEK
ncbi:MAG: hypothetical protein ACTSQP_20215 [Promethearchaeota archaeon]